MGFGLLDLLLLVVFVSSLDSVFCVGALGVVASLGYCISCLCALNFVVSLLFVLVASDLV